MHDELMNARARSVAARLPEGFGIDPVTVVSILTTILPLIVKCFQREDSVSSGDVRSRVAEMYSAKPKRTIRRTKVAVKRQKPELTDQQAETLAKAIVDDCCLSDETEVAAFCSAAESDSSTSTEGGE